MADEDIAEGVDSASICLICFFYVAMCIPLLRSHCAHRAIFQFVVLMLSGDDEVEPEPEDDSDWAADALQNGARRKRKATVSAGSDDGNVVENDPDDDVSGGDEAASDADESDELEIRSTLSRSSATNRTQKRTTKVRTQSAIMITIRLMRNKVSRLS